MELITAKKNLKVKTGRKVADADDATKQVDEVLEIPTEFKKFESIAEAMQDAGSEENLLAYVNQSVKADSATPVRNYKPSEGESNDKTITNCQSLRKDWSIKNTIRDGLSQKEKAETLDEVTKLLDSGADRDTILAAIRKSRG